LGKIGSTAGVSPGDEGLSPVKQGNDWIWRSSKQNFEAAGGTAGKVPLIFPEKSFGRGRVQLPLSEE
jgi:hypothetical protein